jgi:hypothetical protein
MMGKVYFAKEFFMKKSNRNMAAALLAAMAALALLFAGCEGPLGDKNDLTAGKTVEAATAGGSNTLATVPGEEAAAEETGEDLDVIAEEPEDAGTIPDPVILAAGADLAGVLASLKTSAESNGDYTVFLGADASLEPAVLSYPGKKSIKITLRGEDGERKIQLSGKGSLFTVPEGVTLALDSNITLTGVEENNAPLVLVKRGGGLELNEGAKITGNKVIVPKETGLPYRAGGVYVSGGSFTMSGGEICENSTYGGGSGGISFEGGSFTMTGGEIHHNDASTYVGAFRAAFGGGVFIYNASFTMTGGEIHHNTMSGSSDGGGVAIDIGKFTLNGGKIYDNIAGYAGGGVFLGSGTIFDFIAGEITDNTSTYNGGGIFAETGSSGIPLNITMGNDAVISGNTALRGAGVYLAAALKSSPLNFTMNGGRISDNITPASTASYGGGFYLIGKGISVIMNDGEISGNKAIGIIHSGSYLGGDGGGIYVYESFLDLSSSNYKFTINGGSILNNTAGGSGGGVYIDSHSKVAITGGLIAGNTSELYGNGVYIGTNSVQNGTFTQSGSPQIDDDIYDAALAAN